MFAVGKPSFFPLPRPLFTCPDKIKLYPRNLFALIKFPSFIKPLIFVELTEILFSTKALTSVTLKSKILENSFNCETLASLFLPK